MNQTEKIKLIQEIIYKANERIPESKREPDTNINISEFIQSSTNRVPVEKFVSTRDIKNINDYLNEISGIKNLTIGIYIYSNDPEHNDMYGNTKMEYFDFAEVIIVTPEKEIELMINWINSITRKIGSYIRVKNTSSWKYLEHLKNGDSEEVKRKVILDRIIVTAAIHSEQLGEGRYYSKEAFLSCFNSLEAITIEKLVRRINNTGKETEGFKVIDISSDQETMEIMKMAYNKLKNNTLEITNYGEKDDKTMVEFIYNHRRLKFILGITSKYVLYEN